MSLAVGCQITTAKESYPVKENLSLQADLLQLISLKADTKEDFQIYPFNGNPALLVDSEMTSQLDGRLEQHMRMINDVAWAPIAGRSFHLVASASKDRTIIIWRIVFRDLMANELLEVPQVVAL